MTYIKINETLYPATISNYGITSEEVEQMFLEFYEQVAPALYQQHS